ncbi:hypothetical protein BDZ97DRAFT_2078713 [Flammula alnicola]|nr:hypothetical protein BDZ97DRAFT_2078713 [Flammula alnicola]
MAFLDHFLLPPDRNVLFSPYRPSIFLLCVLIFWSGTTVISEIIIAPVTILYSLTTYGPTMHFAVQSIVRTIRGSHTAESDVKKTSSRAVTLACVWIATLSMYVWFWWTERSRGGWENLILLPTAPGSQATIVIVYIAARSVADIRMREREGKLRIALDEENVVYEQTPPTQPNESNPNDNDAPTDHETEAAHTAPDSVTTIYQPSIFLLVVSIALTVCIVIETLKVFPHEIGVLEVFSIQAYIPTVLLQFYTMTRIARGFEQTLSDASRLGGFSFELVGLWLGTRIFYILFLPYYGKAFWIGAAETFLIIYFAVRYSRSIYQERRRRSMLGLDEPETVEDESAQSTNEPLPTQEGEPPSELPASSFYHPSIFILIPSVLLSGACIYIESRAEPAIGAPMSLIVYAPTIVIHTYLIVQWFYRTSATTQKVNQATELSLQLCFIWVLTQAFYILVWPVSQYLNPKVMDPRIRWPEVILIVYIAARCTRNGYIRRSGAIALPPDKDPAAPADEVSDPEAPPPAPPAELVE